MRAPRTIAQATLAGLVAAGVALLLPAAAGAAPETFGSALAPGPTSFGCETEPFLTTDWSLVPSGDPDCTWWQTGVFGVPSDPRRSSVTSTGTVTRLDVFGGTNPSPIRVVVLRQLGTPGAGSDCCFFVSETPSLQPAPNVVTSFPLNVPVAHASVVGGIRADDYIGISAATGGTAPIRVVGSTTAFAFTQPGSVNAAFLYPRFGSIPNDGGGGRREQGIPGIEVLARWTFCATGDPTCDPGAAPQALPPVAPPALVAQLARIQRGSALIRLVCNGNVICEGQLELINLGALAKVKKTTVYGKKSYKIAAGKKLTVKVKLNKKGKRLLKGRKRVKVGLRLTPKGGTATTARITLKR